MRRVAQRVRTQPELMAQQHDHAFLVGSHIDRATLERAEREAAHSGVATHAVLLAAGWVSQADYAAALARTLGVGVALWDMTIEADTAAVDDPADEHGLPGLVRGQRCRVLNATNAAPAVVSRRVAALRTRGFTVVLAPQFSIDAAREVHCRSQRIDRAVRGLLRERPAISAGSPARTWQVVAAAGTVGATFGGLFVFPEATLAALTGLIALPFLCVTLLRLVALRQVLARSPARKARKDMPRLADRSLPVYSILVPLLREGNVLSGLVQALRALDYPAAKLDIILVLETGDAETQAALLALGLPGNFRTLVVPAQPPQTKPKALNYALQFARGDFVVVYDAEDRPETGQLRHALDLFRTAGPGLVCVQAQLNIYNAQRSWLTRGIMAQTPVVPI